ncbi:M23 family metallopeptidase [Leifsonia sp. NCR5]|uniref:M23 family metallopeptidase n=1 Tax=Leifsonia sp. NCR5 TaxID=1978342 RepID=UPI000A18A7A8|nr:M23 family metallopeptidase [Leifsonia sp. NCR5]
MTPDRLNSPVPQRPVDVSATPDAVPLTRRALRERERMLEAGRRCAEGPTRATPTPRTSPTSRSRRGLSAVALTFAVAIGVATSVPAMALLTEEDVRAQAIQAQQVAPAAPSDGVQGFAAPAQQGVASIVRDGMQVSSREKVAGLRSMRIADTFTNNPAGAVQWPFPLGVPISDWFGPRAAPTEGASTNHMGIDFTPGSGVPIQIMADGVVREVVTGDNGGCGVNVTIDHMIGGQLVSSKYCHMQSGSVRVSVGQQVKVAETVGLVGNTGVSTGAHLHFEILLDGTRQVDPYAWLTANAS